MRIWFINHSSYAPSESAGTRHYNLSRELIRRGHETTVITTSFYHKTRKETRLKPGETWKKEIIDGVPFVWLGSPPYERNSPKRLWNMLVFAWRVRRQVGLRHEPPPDVVIGSSPDAFAAWAALHVARRYDVPFLVEIRDLWPDTLVDLAGMSPWHPLVLVLGWLEKHLYREADRILTVLPGSPERMVQKGADPDRIVWLPNGCDLTAADVEPPTTKNDKFTLMYAGAHGFYNGLDIVLDAAELLEHEGLEDQIHIRLVGDGPHKHELQKTASERGSRIVSFQPPVPKSEVFLTLRQADAFLMILRHAPVFKWGISPNKLFDYMAAGRPVLFAVDTPFNPIAEAGAGVSVTPDSAAALADGIKTLANLADSERRAMGRRARQYVEQHHSYRKLAERLETILLEVTA